MSVPDQRNDLEADDSFFDVLGLTPNDPLNGFADLPKGCATVSKRLHKVLFYDKPRDLVPGVCMGTNLLCPCTSCCGTNSILSAQEAQAGTMGPSSPHYNGISIPSYRWSLHKCSYCLCLQRVRLRDETFLRIMLGGRTDNYPYICVIHSHFSFTLNEQIMHKPGHSSIIHFDILSPHLHVHSFIGQLFVCVYFSEIVRSLILHKIQCICIIYFIYVFC